MLPSFRRVVIVVFLQNDPTIVPLYKGRWIDHNGKGSSWDPEVSTALKENSDFIMALRTDDRANGYFKYGLAKTLVCKHMGITSEKPKKKRKTSKSADAAAAAAAKEAKWVDLISNDYCFSDDDEVVEAHPV